MKTLKKLMNLQLFALNPNKTTDNTAGNDLSPGMKTFYSDYIVELASAKLYHDQFGQKQNIPKNGGDIIEFRKYNPLPKLTTPLMEGVTPDGQKMDMAKVSAKVKQYGGYVALTDWLELTHVDDVIVQTTKLIGSQAGRTLDTITREIINAGTSVQYGDKLEINARHLLSGGNDNEEDNCYLTTRAVELAVRYLKNQNAEPIDDSYVAIIHPDIAFDIRTKDKSWIDVKTYSDPNDIYTGEIGKIAGVRFVESPEAKVFTAKDLSEKSRNLTVSSVSGKTVTVKETLTENDRASLAGRSILIGVAKYEVESVSGNVLTLTETAPSSAESGTVIYPGEAGAKGRAVYSTLVIGANAYGTTEIENGGLEFITHQKGSAGSADALNQRSTVGWKASKTAEILVEQYMVRIETASTFDGTSD